MRACSHVDDKGKPAWREKRRWKAGTKDIIEEACDKCGRIARSFASHPGDEARLSGRLGFRKATA